MHVAVLIGLLVVGFVAARSADLLHRIRSPDMVAVAFAEGGDDGYYVFTVARNIASGHGATIDQVNWTTGFQPLWTFLCSLAWLVTDDRGALAVIYAVSLVLWFAGAFFLVRLVREATGSRPAPAATAVMVALFLCETQLGQNYINGLETGLYLTLCLVLLLAFQRHLDRPPPAASWKAAIWLGALCGTVMLARNDAVFICAALIGVTLLAGDWKRAAREALVIVAVASLMVAPWLAYCYWLSGELMPQSAIATSIALREVRPDLETVLRTLVMSVLPMQVVKARTIVAEHWLVLGWLVPACVGVLIAVRRAWMPTTRRGFRLVLIGFAAGTALLVAYYVIFSRAGYFFERYFTPVKLMVAILLSLAVARAFEGRKAVAAGQAAATVLAVIAIASNLYWIWRDYHLPFRGYMGEQAHAIVRSPYSREGLRLGIAESGRIGFLYPDRVVNLDGKMRLDVLQALRNRKIGEFIQSNAFDYLLLHPLDIEFFDELSPDWRRNYSAVGKLDTFDVFARTSVR